MPNLPQHGPSHAPLSGDPVPPWDPANGIYIYDDFLWGSATDSRYQAAASSAGGGVSNYSLLAVSGVYDAFHRCQGVVEIVTGTGVSGGGGVVVRGQLGTGANPAISGYQLGFGSCTLKSRIAVGHGLIQKGNSCLARFGFWQHTSTIGAATVAAATAIGALTLEYSPDNNGGNLRIGYTVSGAVGNMVSLTYVNCTNAVPNFGQFEWWELDIDSSLNVTALLNGNIIGTASAIAPSNLPMCLLWTAFHSGNFLPNGFMTIDDLYLYYPYNRR